MATQPIDYSSDLIKTMPGSYQIQQTVALDKLRQQLGQQQATLGQQQIAANIEQVSHAQQGQAALQAAVKDGSPAALAGVIAQYPEYSKQIKEAHDLKDAAAQKADFSSIGQALASLDSNRPDLAAKVIRERAAAEKATGQDTSDDEALAARLEAGDKDAIKEAQTSLRYTFASIDPAKFAENYKIASGAAEGKKFTNTPQGDIYDTGTGEVTHTGTPKSVIKSVRNGDGSTSLVQVNPDGSMSSAPHPAGASGDEIEQIALAAVPGATVTSRARTPEHNAEVGGVPNSYHLSNQARDIVPPQGMAMAEFHNRIQSVMPGMRVLNEGDHVHIQPSGPAPKFSKDGTKVLYTSAPKAAAATNDAEKLSDDALSSLADQYLAGDKSVFTNLGRGAQGGGNVVRLRNMIAQRARNNGMSGSQVAAQMVDFAGSMAASRAAGTSIANIEQASIEAAKLIPLALQASDAIPRSQFVPFAKAQQMVQAGTNNVALRKFVAANNALVNVYSRAINPKGTPTVADKEHARDLLNTGFDQASYRGVVQQMQKEIQASREAPKQVRADIRGQVSSGGRGNAGVPSDIAAILKKYGH